MVSFEASPVFEPCVFLCVQSGSVERQQPEVWRRVLGRCARPSPGVGSSWGPRCMVRGTLLAHMPHHVLSHSTPDPSIIRVRFMFFSPLTALDGFEFIIGDIQSMCNHGNKYQHWQQSSFKVVGVDFAEHERTFPALLTQQSLFLYFFFSLHLAFGKLNTLPPWMVGALLRTDSKKIKEEKKEIN